MLAWLADGVGNFIAGSWIFFRARRFHSVPLMRREGMATYLAVALVDIAGAQGTPCWTAEMIRSAGYDIAHALWLVDAFFWAAVLLCLSGWCTILDRYRYTLSSMIHPSELMFLFIALFGGPVWAVFRTCKTHSCTL